MRDLKELKVLQSLRLPLKIEWTRQKIRDWHEHWDGQISISYSGGIDSHVLLHLARQEFPDIPAVFVDTGLEYPEIREFVKEQSNIEWIRPKMNFKEVIEHHGYPIISKRQAQYIREARTMKAPHTVNLRLTGYSPDGRFRPSSRISRKWLFLLDAPFKISEKCCNVLKKNPIRDYTKRTGLKCVVGTMAADSEERALQWMKRGCNAFYVKMPQSYPLSIWNKQDVLQYIMDNGLGFCSVYGNVIKENGVLRNTGVSRTGCTFCGFGCHLQNKEEGINKFQRMTTSHPELYKYCMENLGMRKVLEFCGIPYKPRQKKGMDL